MASRRKRGPVASRPWLWGGLPFFHAGCCQEQDSVNSGICSEGTNRGQIWPILNICFGSVAVSLPQIAWVAGFGHKQPLGLTSIR